MIALYGAGSAGSLAAPAHGSSLHSHQEYEAEMNQGPVHSPLSSPEPTGPRSLPASGQGVLLDTVA